MSNWTKEQIDVMLQYAEEGVSIEDASAGMITTYGWNKRTVPSIRSKYRSYTGLNWPNVGNKLFTELADDTALIVEDYEERITELEKESSKNTTLLFLLLVGVGLVYYGWVL
jgi:hypothetical protein